MPTQKETRPVRDQAGNEFAAHVQSNDSTDKFAALRLAHADGCVLDDEPAGGDL